MGIKPNWYGSLFLIIAWVYSGCSADSSTKNSDLESFSVRAFHTKYQLEFNFPKTFVSVRKLMEANRLDTMDADLHPAIRFQSQEPNGDSFYDSANKKLNIFIKAGPRVDISNKERNPSFFTVPTVALDKIFPPEDSIQKIISDSGEQHHNEKTYFKRQYAINSINPRFSDFYYISTEWQSVVVFVLKDSREVNLDNYILNYTVRPRE